MSSVDSPGVCLSTEKSHLSLSNETGQALTDPSISVESLSLTNISHADNSNFRQFSAIPTLLTLPQEKGEVMFMSRPPQLLSMIGKDSATSGITTSMEGTLDDIPDFQDTVAPVTNVYVTPVPYTEPSPLQKISSPPSAQKSPGTLSTPSGTQLEAEARFIEEVKQTTKGRRPSSAKSFASTTGPKTSTSGVTVVEVKTPAVLSQKPPIHSTGAALSNQPSEDDISEGILNQDSQSGFSDIITSPEVSSNRDVSDYSAFAKFKPTSRHHKKPFLLRMPSEEEFHQHHQENTPDRKKDNVLNEIKTTIDSNKTAMLKSWRSLENESRTSKDHKGYYKVVYVDKHNRKHSKRHTAYEMNSNGIKQIVKDEMNAVVTMQNDIWHKILDSFVDKNRESSHGARHQIPVKKATVNGNTLTMLSLPKEDDFYKPLDIPIIKPAEQPKFFLTLPPEPVEDKLQTEIEQELKKSSDSIRIITDTGKSCHPPNVNVSIQTSETLEKPKTKTESCQVEHIHIANQDDNEDLDGVQTGPSTKIQKSNRKILSQPLVDNTSYQSMINQSEIPIRAIEECKILLESIQNSANELKQIKNNFESMQPFPKEENVYEISPPQNFHRNKHEIFLDNFFGKPKRTGAQKFLDVQDITSVSELGHFREKKKASNSVAEKASTSGVSDTQKPALQPDTTAPDVDEATDAKVLSSNNVISDPQNADRTEDASADEPESTGPEVPSVEKNQSLLNDTSENIQFSGEDITDSLSSVDKYLSLSRSSSDKTITMEDNITVEKGKPELSLPAPEIHDPGVIGTLIQDNITNIKQYLSTAKSHEHERSKKVNMLLQSRRKVQSPKFSHSLRRKAASPTFSNSSQCSSSRVTQQHKPSLQMGETRTLLKGTHQPPFDGKKLSIASKHTDKRKNDVKVDVSLSSGTTSLPTNTEDLVNAALAGSEITLSVAQKKTLQAVDKQPADQSKDKLRKWMERKRKIRMAEFQKERKAKIEKEAKPFKPGKVVVNRKVTQFNRKAAIIRRLHTAETLLDNIKKSPQKMLTPRGNTKHGGDKTLEWVQSVDINDLDSVHSPSLNSDGGGASQITPDLSLP